MLMHKAARSFDTVLTVRISEETLAFLKEQARAMQARHPGVRYSMSDIVRMQLSAAEAAK